MAKIRSLVGAIIRIIFKPYMGAIIRVICEPYICFSVYFESGPATALFAACCFLFFEAGLYYDSKQREVITKIVEHLKLKEQV